MSKSSRMLDLRYACQAIFNTALENCYIGEDRYDILWDMVEECTSEKDLMIIHEAYSQLLDASLFRPGFYFQSGDLWRYHVPVAARQWRHGPRKAKKRT